MPPSVSLRRVTNDAAAFLAIVFAASRPEIAALPWNDEQKQAFLAIQAAAQRADYERRFPDADHDLVLVDGRRAGRLWVHRGDDEIRLLDITLLPPWRNRGIGSALIRGLQTEAAESGRPLRHAVVKENQAALDLYTSLGFEVTGDLGTHLTMEWKDITPG